MFKPKGIFPPHITPFDRKGELDIEALKGCIKFWVESGVSGLVPCGSNGEAPYLSREERRRVIETVIESVGGRITVIAGTGGIGTKETVALTRDAEELGADAALVVTPFFYRFSRAELMEHYSTILNSTDLPVLLYNVPKFTGYSLEPEIVAELAESHSNLVGVKDSSGDMGRIARLIDLVGDKISVLAGSTDILLPTLTLGGGGAVIATAIVFPELCVEIYKAFMGGDLKRAASLQLKASKINHILVRKRNQISAIKATLRVRGLKAGFPRMPTLDLNSGEVERIRVELKEFL